MNICLGSRTSRKLPIVALVFLFAAPLIVLVSPAQQTGPADHSSVSAAPPTADARPLPDIPTLLRDVGKNQRALEELRKLYTSHLSEEEDKINSDGEVKSRTVKDYDVFYIGDEEVRHLLATDGKPLEGGEKKSEDDRFSKQFD